jgi:hypothetical protein
MHIGVYISLPKYSFEIVVFWKLFVIILVDTMPQPAITESLTNTTIDSIQSFLTHKTEHIYIYNIYNIYLSIYKYLVIAQVGSKQYRWVLDAAWGLGPHAH